MKIGRKETVVGQKKKNKSLQREQVKVTKSVTPFCILFFGAFGGVHNPSADHHETNVAA